MKVKIKRLPNYPVDELPEYKTIGSAGMDLHADLTGLDMNGNGGVTINSGEIIKVPTGLAIALPIGYEAQIRPRSGLAIKQGVTVVNSPGTIDSDYRGQIVVGLINLTPSPVFIQHTERIAQMIVAPVMQVEWDEVDELDETDRGEGGLGSTGR